MLVFWSRFPTIGGPRPETWRWLASMVAPRPIFYTNHTVRYWMNVKQMRARGVLTRIVSYKMY